MKKIVRVFNRSKDKKDNFHSFHKDYVDGSANTFRSFQFDTNTSNNFKIKFNGSNNSSGIEACNKDPSQPDIVQVSPINYNPLVSNKLGVTDKCVPTLKEIPKMNSNPDIPSGVDVVKLKQLGNSQGVFVPKKTINNNLKPEALITEGKFKNSICNININNSRYFHIGSKTTINVNSSTKKNQKSLSNNKLVSFETDVEKLLDNQDRLSDAFMRLIALNFEGEWETFAINLGLNIDIIEETAERFDKKSFKVYHVLQECVKEFPNTTTGFVLSILRDSCQLEVIKKLLQYKNKWLQD